MHLCVAAAALAVASSQAASQSAAAATSLPAGSSGSQPDPAEIEALWQDRLALAAQGGVSAADLAALRQQLAAAGVLGGEVLSPEEAVGLTASLRPGLAVDDVYDAHPVMLPLVRLMEKALTLPSDVEVCAACCLVAKVLCLCGSNIWPSESRFFSFL